MNLESFRAAVTDSAKCDPEFARLKFDVMERDGLITEVAGETWYRPDGPESAPLQMPDDDLLSRVAADIRACAPAKLQHPDYDAIRNRVNEKAERVRANVDHRMAVLDRKLSKNENVHPKLRNL
jgi:hypothetical protein